MALLLVWNLSGQDVPIDKGVGVSSNPSSADHIGTGELGKKLLNLWGIDDEETGFSLEGLWILNANQLFSGGKENRNSISFDNLFQLELLYDTEKGKLSRLDPF